MNHEELKKALYILATINQHVQFPSLDACLSTIFENAFSSGIDDESLETLNKPEWKNSNSVYQCLKDIIKSQEWENIFEWPNKQMHLFQIDDLPKKIEKVAFFCFCAKREFYTENIKGYNLIAKQVYNKCSLYCKYKEEWKECSSSKAIDMNDTLKIFPLIMCFVKDGEKDLENEKTEGKNEIEEIKIKEGEKETKIEKLIVDSREFEENATEKINKNEINKKFKQIQKEFIAFKQDNVSLRSELESLKEENKRLNNEMEKVKEIIEITEKSADKKINDIFDQYNKILHSEPIGAREENKNSEIEIKKMMENIGNSYDKKIEDRFMQCNEKLCSDLVFIKEEIKNTSMDMKNLTAVMEYMGKSADKKIDNICKTYEKEISNLKERFEENETFIKCIRSNIENSLLQLKLYWSNSIGWNHNYENEKVDSSPLSCISNYFEYINKITQDCFQQCNELKNEYNSLTDKCNKISETNENWRLLEAKINNIEETKKNISISNESELIQNQKFTPTISRPNNLNSCSPRRKKGLANIGNSCYLNSILQIFASIPNFIENIRNIESDLFKWFIEVIDSMTDPYAIKMKEKLRALRNSLSNINSMFGEYNENDCKELYIIMINLFMESIESSMFVIDKNQVFICDKDHKVKSSEASLFLTIPDNELSVKEWLDSLDNETKIFEGENNLFCERCGERADSKIVTESIEPHEILVFYNAKRKNRLESISDYVSLGQNQYELFGVIWYNGNHYIAYTRDNGVWNEYNDQRVTPNKSPNPNNSYMLFYKKYN